MAGSWFVNAGGKVHGPFDDATFRALAAAGKVTPETPIAGSATGPWMRAAAVRGLFSVGGAAPARPPGPPPLPVRPASLGAPAAVPSAETPDYGLPHISAKPSRTTLSKNKKRGSTAKLSGLLGGLVGVAIVIFNVGVLIRNGYLWTDTAAIDLIKASMQETFAEDPSLAKPVKVLEVKLHGKGTDRTGTATVKFGGKPHKITFTVKVTRSEKGLEVDWKAEDMPTTIAKAGDPNEAAFKEQFQALVVALSDLGTVEIQLRNSDAQLTSPQVSQLVRKLARGWGELLPRAKAIRDMIGSRGFENAADPAQAKKFAAALMSIEMSTPAILKVLNTILASKSDAEIAANFETYASLSTGVGEAFQQIAPPE